MKKLLVALMVLCAFGMASAEDIKLQPTLTKSQLEDIAKNIGSVIYFNPSSPNGGLGITGFDVAAEATFTRINLDSAAMQNSTEDNQDWNFVVPMTKIHLQKGLPYNINIGGYYGSVPMTNIKAWGLEASYDILEGTLATPAVSVRTTFSQLQGIDDLEARTASLEAYISKGFLILKPYAGVAAINTNLEEKSAYVDYENVNVMQYKGIAGLQITPFPLLKINAEVAVGDNTQFSLKAGIRF